ncbi:DNA polymerase-3 subunit delta [Geomicrobium halophilum]|uniref:DNA polymerase III subunit delta n=1 Tax=Geomicrobium halophilum TaxID=549000 RepID=A0A841PWS9_9BACL|nr:DNA polymerase III subunit delta [Geomicrobium halophilum]MBB6448813.1 DNA polymerase-3 subunit delta [Geomicrobium halophilum]
MGTYMQVKNDIKAEKFTSVYLIYGTERYIIDDLVKHIGTYALREEERAFNLSQLDMREVPVQEGIEEAETAAFFGPRRVIILHHARFLTGAKDKDMPAHDVKRMERFLAELPPEHIVIITVEAEKLDERKKIVKKLKAAGETVEAAPLKGEGLKEWITGQAHDRGVTLTAGAIEELLGRSNSDLLTLEKEIEKCAQYLNHSGAIDEDIVDALVPRSLEDNIFQLIDAVSDKQTAYALQVFDDLLRNGEEPIKIITLLGRQFRMMGLAAEMERRGYSQQKMAGQLGVPPFVAKRLRQKAKYTKGDSIARALSYIAETDYKMKQGMMEKKSGVALLIARLPHILST